MKQASILFAMMALIVGFAIAQVGPPAEDAFWVDDEKYRTVATPTDLPGKGPKDGIYVFSNINEQIPVAEAKPGDRDYNGGRWQVYVLALTEDGLAVHDADDDGVIDSPFTNWEMVEHHIGLGHIEVVAEGPSFVCPVIKQK